MYFADFPVDVDGACMKCRYPGWLLHGVAEVQIGEIGVSELMAGLERTLSRTTAMEQFLKRPFMADCRLEQIPRNLPNTCFW